MEYNPLKGTKITKNANNIVKIVLILSSLASQNDEIENREKEYSPIERAKHISKYDSMKSLSSAFMVELMTISTFAATPMFLAHLCLLQRIMHLAIVSLKRYKATTAKANTKKDALFMTKLRSPIPNMLNFELKGGVSLNEKKQAIISSPLRMSIF